VPLPTLSQMAKLHRREQHFAEYLQPSDSSCRCIRLRWHFAPNRVHTVASCTLHTPNYIFTSFIWSDRGPAAIEPNATSHQATLIEKVVRQHCGRLIKLCSAASEATCVYWGEAFLAYKSGGIKSFSSPSSPRWSSSQPRTFKPKFPIISKDYYQQS